MNILADGGDRGEDELTNAELDWHFFKRNEAFDIACVVDNGVGVGLDLADCEHGDTPFYQSQSSDFA